jgi:hypothetical protein
VLQAATVVRPQLVGGGNSAGKRVSGRVNRRSDSLHCTVAAYRTLLSYLPSNLLFFKAIHVRCEISVVTVLPSSSWARNRPSPLAPGGVCSVQRMVLRCWCVPARWVQRTVCAHHDRAVGSVCVRAVIRRAAHAGVDWCVSALGRQDGEHEPYMSTELFHEVTEKPRSALVEHLAVFGEDIRLILDVGLGGVHLW